MPAVASVQSRVAGGSSARSSAVTSEPTTEPTALSQSLMASADHGSRAPGAGKFFPGRRPGLLESNRCGVIGAVMARWSRRRMMVVVGLVGVLGASAHARAQGAGRAEAL